uniref:NAD-dependent epimerase/dehydratase domain-containing protein n=1 Tax=Manihot esculenta TaxID=3983 RepID=A0A2C9VVA2_MANES
MDKRRKVCVTGAAGYLGDTSKAGLLKGLPNAETKIIYTASVVAASPMKEDGTGFKDSMNESCWTPFNLSFPYSNEIVTAYTQSKTLSEQRHNGELEIVSITCGLVGGGGTISTGISDSMLVMLSQAMNDKQRYEMLRYLEELMGKRLPSVCKNSQLISVFLKRREIVWGSTKLEELGFKYKHDINNILDGSFKHARKLGLI